MAVAVAYAPSVPGAAGAGVARLSVSKLMLTDFRSYARLRLEVGPRAVVLTGPNGAGKTNLLEAVSLLAPGRGLRRARLADLARRDPGGAEVRGRGWAVAAQVEGPLGTIEVGTGIEALAPEEDDEDRAERRSVRIDGRPVRGPAALAETAAVRWLTPSMDRMFADGTSPRRRFLDRLVSGWDPGHAARVAAYERTMRQRSRLLREGGFDARWVAALEETLAEIGTAIAAARLDYAGRLATVMAEPGAPEAGAHFAVHGDLEAWLEAGPALAAETNFREALARGRVRDGAAGGAGTGPHRSDLAVRHANGLDAAQCSTGEQKSLLFAIVEADARLLAASTGRPPLLLLDEVSAHLDERRRGALFDAALTIGAQVWATGTDRSVFAALEGRAQFLAVAGGRVETGLS